jgi:hypothetical protein
MSEAVETKQNAVEPSTKKAAPKRKPAAKKKAPAKRKPAAKKAAARKPVEDFANRAQEAGREAFLASLGFYGKAFDQVQEQFESLQERMEERRKQADKLYQELVKRGEKVEADAKGRLESIELPKFELDSLTDRAKLEEQLEKARARFEELKESVRLKSAA